MERSLKVSRAPFAATPSVPKKSSCPGYRMLVDFLERKRSQYLMGESTKASAASVRTRSTGRLEENSLQSLGTLEFETDSEKFAELVLLKAKANLKLKRKNRRKSISDLCHQHSSEHIRPLSARPLTNQSTAKLLVRSSDNQSDISPPNYCAETGVTKKQSERLYHGSLYKQVESEWKNSLLRQKQLPKVKPTLVSQRRSSTKTIAPFTQRQSNTNLSSSKFLLPAKTSFLNKSVVCVAQLPVKKLSVAANRKEELERKIKEELLSLKSKQRSEIYALNKVMRELEETRFKEAIAKKV